MTFNYPSIHLRILRIALTWLSLCNFANAQWQQAMSNTTQTLMSVEYGAGQWVAVGNGGTIVTSTDGITWTPRTSNITYTLRAVRYNAGQWITVGDNGTILTSPDGIIWTPRISNTNQSLNGISYSGVQWIANNNSYSYTNQLLTSIDGITWTVRTLNIYFYDIKGGDGKWVAATTGSAMISLDEGVTWRDTRSSFREPYVYVSYSNGHWAIGSGYYGITLTSPDGTNWKGGGLNPPASPRDLSYGNNIWMKSSGSVILIASDSDPSYIYWQNTYNNAAYYMYQSCYGGELWVAIGANGAILYNANPTGLSLPVSLVSFQGQSVGNDAQLTWETAWEKVASHFLVERSQDAKSFEAVGRVEAEGTTTQNQHYSFLDKDLDSGIWYYRLRQVDSDGTYTPSQIIAIRIGTDPLETPALWPNPGTGPMVLEYRGGIQSVSIHSLNGVVVQQQRFDQAVQQWSWDSAFQPSGMYLVRVQKQDGNVLTLHWMKQ